VDDQDEPPTTEVSADALTVGDLMSPSVATVREDQDLRTALEMFRTTGLRHLVVVTGAGEFVGVLGDRVGIDLAGQDERQLAIARVHDLPQDRRAQTAAGTGIVEAARSVLHHSAGALAVTNENGHVIGIVTGADLLRGLLEVVDGALSG
jgi:predicted transcriptional regulator